MEVSTSLEIPSFDREERGYSAVLCMVLYCSAGGEDDPTDSESDHDRAMGAGSQNSFGHKIHLELPFSWHQFFFASVAFTVGNLLFEWRCPDLVKEYSKPFDSYSAGNGSVFLCHQTQDLPFHVMSERLRSDLLYMFRRAEQASGIQVPSAQAWIDENGEEAIPSAFEIADLILAGLCMVKREEMGDLFSLIYNAFDKCRPFWRIAVACCYAVGFVLIGMILYSNIQSVIHIINQPQ